MSELFYVGFLGMVLLVVFLVVYLREWVDERRGRGEGEVEIASKLHPDGIREEILLVRRRTKDGYKRFIVRRWYKGRKLVKGEVITEVDKVVIGMGSLWIMTGTSHPDKIDGTGD